MKILPLILSLFLPVIGTGAPFTRTIAGTGQKGHDPGGRAALETAIDNPFGVTRGPDGLIYVCEYKGHCIRRIEKDGTLTIIAGKPGQNGYSGDGGPAHEARLFDPHEIRFDSQGRLYMSDTSNHVVRRIDDGIISTVAGTGEAGFTGDEGPATEAKLNKPISIQIDRGDNLYICDIGNHRVRVVSADDGRIRTLSGTGKRELPEDGGKFRDQPLKGPRTLDFDSEGNVWLALRDGNALYKLDLAKGTLHHIAGTGKKGFKGNGGPAKDAQLAGPKGLSVGPDGNVYLADTESQSIRRINLSKQPAIIELVCGTGKNHDGPDGDPLKCGLARPHGVYVEKDGSILIGDSENHRVRRLSLSAD